MYLPRGLISLLYKNLERTRHTSSSPVLLLVALEPDALCACRILTTLFKRDYIPHNIIPIAGYADLSRVGEQSIQPMRLQNGGNGGIAICLGVGGLVDLGEAFGLDSDDGIEDVTGGVEIWVIDARRPWNLGNVFGGHFAEDALNEINGNARKRLPDVEFGEIKQHYQAGRGGIIVFDDGDISEELEAEREAYFKLEQLPEIEDDGHGSDHSESGSEGGSSESSRRKRKTWSDASDEENEDEERPRLRKRSSSGGSISSSPTRPARHGLVSTSSMIPSSYPSDSQPPDLPPPSRQEKPILTRRNRRRLLRLKRKHETTLRKYYSLGLSYSEPISSLIYSLASDLGREDNDALWHAIVGVSSLEIYGRAISGINPPPSEFNPYIGWGSSRGERILQVLRDEVRRLNPPDVQGTKSKAHGDSGDSIPTTGISPTDTSIKLSQEPRFLLVRHWSLHDSMLHSPYLAARLHLWTDIGRKRLSKLLAKMGVSIKQSEERFMNMDLDLKRALPHRLLKYGPMYGLEGLVPPAAINGKSREGWGFVRSWGWEACLSASDVGVIVGAILEVGKREMRISSSNASANTSSQAAELIDDEGRIEGEEYVERFWEAYDALENVLALVGALPSTMHLHRAILRTGTALLSKSQIRHLRAFRMAVVRDGPDVQLFTHPGALTKLALWVGEAIIEQERSSGNGSSKPTPLVLASLNERRGVYVVVGTGGRGLDFGKNEKEKEEKKKVKEKKLAEKKEEKAKAKAEKRAARQAAKKAKADATGTDAEDAEEKEQEETEDETEDDDESDSDLDSDEEDAKPGRNRFGNSFQEVVAETNARVRIESFDHCVVEVRKDDLGVFLESLSSKSVMG